MSVKAILILCAQVLYIQSALSQCNCGGNYGAGLAGSGAPVLAAPAVAIGANNLASGLGYGAGISYGAGLGYGAGSGYSGLAIEAIPTSGGSLPVISSSAIAPSSLSISSENVYEGALSVAGELPFLSAVALDGVFSSAGAGVVNFSAGNGVTAIDSIIPSAGGYTPGAAAYAPGIPAIGVAPGVGALATGLTYGSGNGILNRGCSCGIY